MTRPIESVYVSFTVVLHDSSVDTTKGSNTLFAFLFLIVMVSLSYTQNFNRHYAEYAGYWQTTDFLKSIDIKDDKPIQFYDSVTGKLLFTAPIGRTMEQFVKESLSHGWPSFRDQEVNWEYVRCLRDGECISTTGTHLGHNLPDSSGNRYCINLVSVAGQPEGEEEAK
jgi:hypothetical protein